VHEPLTPGVIAQPDYGAQFYEEPDMKTDLNYSPQRHARAHWRAGSASASAAPLASSARYTCSTQPETVHGAPTGYPEHDMPSIPIPETIARAAMLLRSLSVVTNALRLNRV